MISFPSLFLLILNVLPHVARVRAACYYPDGSIAPNDTPCQDLTAESTCCGQGYACLSNGMCQATGKELSKDGATELVRGACTDRSWRSSSCPLFCINPETDNVAGGIGIAKCDGTVEELYYCINSVMNTVNCTAKKNVLFFQRESLVFMSLLGPVHANYLQPFGQSPNQFNIAESPTAITTIGVAATSTPSSTSTTSTLIATTAIIAPSANPSSAPNPSSVALSSATQSPQSSPTSSPETGPSVEPEATNDKTVIIGAAVGASVGGLALGVLAAWLFIFLRRRKRRARREAAANAQAQVEHYTPGPPLARYVSPPVFDQVYEAPNEWKPPLVSDHFAPQELPAWQPEPRRS
ncbi:hypothetical protein CSIM01_09668 [Colletotrichum simmondsii]|uniref:Mid2 domain-containing protein n=1 Tax=Colletotrichum simmondsii TaxID=703756 RepID=A0A135TBU8_9PEZI|nr:hypothetical protein CSIM01_09668 [Colletotrichum simmondsii]